MFSMQVIASEHDETVYLTPKLDFVNLVGSKNSPDFATGYSFDIGFPIYKNIYFENIVRYVDWNKELFDDNFLQYGSVLKLKFPFFEYTDLSLSGGFLADLDVGNESRKKEVNPYLKLDVGYKVNDRWTLILGYNQAFSSKYLDQYAYSLGARYSLFGGKSDSSDSLKECFCDKSFVENKIIDETVNKKIDNDIKEPINVVEKDSNENQVITDYIVKKGDHLYKIANLFNIKFEDFKLLNPKFFSQRDPNIILPGEVVKIRLE